MILNPLGLTATLPRILIIKCLIYCNFQNAGASQSHYQIKESDMTKNMINGAKEMTVFYPFSTTFIQFSINIGLLEQLMI